jgi:hypothetical protein
LKNKKGIDAISPRKNYLQSHLLQVLPLQMVLLKVLDRRTLSQASVTLLDLEYVLPHSSEEQSTDRRNSLLPNNPLRTRQVLLLLLQESHSFAAATVGSGATGASPAKAVTVTIENNSARNNFIFPP